MNSNKETKQKLIQLIQDYKNVFKSDEGSRVLEDLEKRCHYSITTFSKDSSHETAFFEGQRSVFLFIKAMINKKE
jgi:hypothetical protein